MHMRMGGNKMFDVTKAVVVLLVAYRYYSGSELKYSWLTVNKFVVVVTFLGLARDVPMSNI